MVDSSPAILRRLAHGDQLLGDQRTQASSTFDRPHAVALRFVERDTRSVVTIRVDSQLVEELLVLVQHRREELIPCADPSRS